MAKTPASRLKVFQTQIGFYDTVIAALSQAAALRTWGVKHNLFATGLAKVADDPQAIEAAQAHPGNVLKRAVGSSDSFEVDPVNLPKLPKGPKRAATGSRQASGSQLALIHPPADRSRLDAAEEALREVDDQWHRDDAALRRRQAQLDSERAAAEAAFAERRDNAIAMVESAREAYRKAGGQQ